MVIWLSGHPDFWPSDHQAIRPSSHPTIWSSGHPTIWSSDHLVIRPSGYLVIPDFWPSDHPTIWSSNHMVIQPSGHMTIWSYGLLSRCLKNVLIGMFLAYLIVGYTNLKFLTSSLIQYRLEISYIGYWFCSSRYIFELDSGISLLARL